MHEGLSQWDFVLAAYAIGVGGTHFMHEGLSQWDFVVAAYAIGIAGTLALTTWAWAAMRRAERRRDETRGRRDD